MADGLKITIRGLPELKAALSQMVPNLRKKAIRESLKAGARLVQREVKRATPVLKVSTYSGASAVRRGVRKVGTVRRAIAVGTNKDATRAGNIGVRVFVRPAKPGQQGAKSPHDPYYATWLNFGWNPAGGDRSSSGRRERRRSNVRRDPKIKGGYRFFEAGVKMLSQALSVFERELSAKLRSLNRGK